MLVFETLADRKILVITANGPIAKADFDKFAERVEEESTTRLMIKAASFPGWESFEAFLAHLKFISEHHRQIERIAMVTDSAFLKVMPRIAGLLVHPKIRQFDVGETDEATAWLETGH